MKNNPLSKISLNDSVKYLFNNITANVLTETKNHIQKNLKQSAKDKDFVVGGLLFTGYHFATREQTIKPILQQVGLDDTNSTVASGVIRKVVGGLVLGVGAYALMKSNGKTFAESGVNSQGMLKSLAMFGVLTPVFAGIVAQNMKQPVMWQYYPEIRTQQFSKPFAVLSSSAWLSYLVGFEFFFRGFLLHHWQQKYNTADSLAMTTVLYTLVHLPNNWREMLSCIPMGYIFGGMSLYANNMASPLFMHWVISTTSDVMSAKHNPNVTFFE